MFIRLYGGTIAKLRYKVERRVPDCIDCHILEIAFIERRVERRAASNHV
jgi:hypothetical protein